MSRLSAPGRFITVRTGSFYYIGMGPIGLSLFCHPCPPSSRSPKPQNGKRLGYFLWYESPWNVAMISPCSFFTSTMKDPNLRFVVDGRASAVKTP